MLNGFCGNDRIWDLDLLTNNTYPEFTPCFQTTVLTWVPCVWLWATLPVFLRYLHRIHQHYPLSKLCIAKMVVQVVLVGVAIASVVSGHLEPYSISKTPASYTAAGIRLATLCLSMCLTMMSRRKGLYSPCLLFLFWFLWLLCDIVPFYTRAMQWNERPASDLAVFYFQYAVILVEFSLFWIADSDQIILTTGADEKRIPCPETTSSFPEKVTFGWMHSIIWTGWRRPLMEEDLWDLPPHIKCKQVVPRFFKNLEKYFFRSHTHPPEGATLIPKIPEKQTLLELQHISQGPGNTRPQKDDLPDVIYKTSQVDDVTASGRVGTFQVLKVLLKTYGQELSRAHIFKLACDIIRFLNPILLKLMIGFIENKQTETIWKGYGLSVCFFLVSVSISLLNAQTFYISHNIAVKIRTGLVAAVYKKSLTMNNESRKLFTTGAIVNLMSVDCNRVEGCISQLFQLWSAPLSLVLCFYFLYQVIGVSMVAGVAVMVVMAPLNYKLVFYMKKLHNKQLSIKDERLKNMNEILNGIKVLKLYAWESSFRDKVMAIRSREIALIKKLAIMNALNVFCWVGAPTLVTLASFVTYVLTSEHQFLDSQTGFVALALFNILREPMNALPMAISNMAQAIVSLDRLTKYLSGQDLDPETVKHTTEKDNVISIEHGQFSWDRDSDKTLKNIYFKVKKGQLIAIVGQVGAGKSSLLSAVLGEMEKIHGDVCMKGSVAYVPQQAWMQNLSLRKNILFGSPHEEAKYRHIIHACSLEADLEVLPGGENTEIGEKGINLSGGQKQRVSLARAVYSDRDIYLLDDPLSAVDSHVGKHIFRNVIGNEGILKDKTRVLVTHGIHWLPMVDVIVVMDQGEISEVGSYEELLDHDGAFAQFLKAYLLEGTQDVGEDDELQEIRAKILERVDSVTSIGKSPLTLSPHFSPLASSLNSPSMSSLPATSLDRDISLQRSTSVLTEENDGPNEEQAASVADDKEDDEEEHRLTDDEKYEIGRVKFSVLKSYFRALGVSAAVLIFFLFFIFQISGILTNVWLSIWTDDPNLRNISFSTNATNVDLSALSYYYLGIYCFLSLAQAFLVMLYVMVTYRKMVRAASIMHRDLLDNILRQSMTFFDTTPTGRILNRFTRDVDIVDNHLPRITRQWLATLFNVFSVLIVIAYSTPLFLAAAIPTLLVYFFVQRMYIPTSRQFRRYHSTTRSPIYSHFTETITGASSIRAYDAVERFCEESLKRVDRNNIFHYAALAAMRWMKMRLEFLGNIIILSAAIFAVVTPGLSGGIVGLSVSYALQMTGTLIAMVQITTDLETNVVSVERMVEYSEIPREAAWTVPDKKPPADWPTEGEVKFDDLQVRYRPELDLVLKGINCRIKPGEKIGVVGRTGAGKSSLTLALFRIVETAGGKILIDGHNIADMGLHDLKSRLTILPQDPVLFSGTMRLNLDPFQEHTDSELWVALERAHLKEFVSSVPKGLQHECEEGGQNLSVGQRQLVCLARSLLRKTKILVLDEATAAVDMETDELIQKTIRSAFHDCTVLTIAHRLNTIMDYDRIMVLAAGQIVEFDSPTVLLEDKAGVFYGLAKDANLVT
ncbi:multidrug resistance-associated protein 1-like [Haliotis asinina]|uniref:multidrug resistance-associated protein 1-like n=1 Tax=Haliotis asinina TaxID=109174 RepID=UPI003531C923